MTKSIRISEYLYGEIERLAEENKRSLIGQLEMLLEQALRMEPEAALSGGGRKQEYRDVADHVIPLPLPESADAQPRDIPTRTIVPKPFEKTFQPDFKKPPEPKKKRR